MAKLESSITCLTILYNVFESNLQPQDCKYRLLNYLFHDHRPPLHTTAGHSSRLRNKFFAYYY